MDPFSAFQIQRNWQVLLCLLPFHKTLGPDGGFTAGVFPGNYNIDITQTPSKLGFGGSHFSHEDMTISQTGFDGALFSATHNTNAMNNEALLQLCRQAEYRAS
jgi:hypothetical protein